jgi:hypothetical protein
VFIVLRLALDGAVRDQLISANPATRVKRPTVTRARPYTCRLPT